MAMNPEIDEYGDKFWYDSDNRFHREDGPAIEYADGDKSWFKNGKSHREDGPAWESLNGNKLYYLEGIHYTKEKYWKKIKQLNKCKLFKLNSDNIDWI